jgi:hypothetical protein
MCLRAFRLPNRWIASINSAACGDWFACIEVQMSALSSSRFHQIPDALWERLDLLIPVYAKSPKGSRPRLRMQNFVVGIFAWRARLAIVVIWESKRH